MAALDFGMALARGMLPTSEKAQKDLLNLAGGRNIFKSEDWWNTQVDKQISSGYRKSEMATGYLLPSGEYTRGDAVTNTSYYRSGIGGTQSSVPSWQVSYSPIFGYGGGIQARTSTSFVAPKNAVRRDGQLVTRNIDIFGSDREDFTAGELSDIEKGAKAGAKRSKREAAQTETAKKRLTRGTGGLAAKARPVGAEATTGLPELGTGGLQLGQTSLGKGLFV